MLNSVKVKRNKIPSAKINGIKRNVTSIHKFSCIPLDLWNPQKKFHPRWKEVCPSKISSGHWNCALRPGADLVGHRLARKARCSSYFPFQKKTGTAQLDSLSQPCKTTAHTQLFSRLHEGLEVRTWTRLLQNWNSIKDCYFVSLILYEK